MMLLGRKGPDQLCFTRAGTVVNSMEMAGRKIDVSCFGLDIGLIRCSKKITTHVRATTRELSRLKVYELDVTHAEGYQLRQFGVKQNG
jgi:hypothetical protein